MSTKRVILYRPPPRAHVTPFPQRTVPVGLMTIAATLRTRGDHDVRLVDGFEGDGPEVLAALARDWQADVVGISGLTAHAYDGMVAAHLVKEARPETTVVAGGIHYSAVPLETMELCSHIDFVVIGEGEKTFLELCDTLEPGSRDRAYLKGVKGIAWMENGELFTTESRPPMKDLGWIPMPAYDLVDPKRYGMKPFRYPDHMMIEGSRGCPFTCSFCHTTQFWKRRWRPRPIDAVLDDMEYVISRMGRNAFHFTDDSWATNRERVIAFCEGVLSRGLDVDIWAQCRVDDLHRNQDLFPLMRRAGFYGFLIGFESGEDENLKRWNKGVNAQKAREIAPLLTEHFDSITGTFFVGDWESVESNFVATRAFADEIEVDIFIEAPLTLFPPTIPIWKEYEDRGIPMNWDYDAIGNCKIILPTKTLSKAQVHDLQGKNMSSFYTSPKKAFHAVTSGKHAARAFSSIILSGLEDTARTWLRDRIPPEFRGSSRLLRSQYRANHIAYAEARGMMAMNHPWA